METTMNIPIQFGLPQVILFIIALVGLVLFISMITGIIIGEEIERDEDDREDVRARGSRKYIRRRRLRAGRGLTGIVLLLLAASLLWATFLVQSYLGLTGDIKVAVVRANPIANFQHVMSVELTLYDKDGHQISDNTYGVMGDDWELQGDIIKFPSWLNVVGLHTGYKLTRLEGRYERSDLERNNKHTVIDLNGGDDNFFKTAQTQTWLSPLVESAYGNAVFLPADGKTYTVFVSQTGLYAVPLK
jgi:hypothetical protein